MTNGALPSSLIEDENKQMKVEDQIRHFTTLARDGRVP
jgi:hypothetical protein